ncbi:putative NmrA-like family domain-containing protein [Mycena alexandri]|uniref:NmrA-like family domain-containing protein n=1 Tax=Mycena alexandri TaxID=1745969 RepID=A0AAD6TL53_9AGAR|nr:putative NmrA-like family domain-containing protein [Mycena alexandri]
MPKFLITGATGRQGGSAARLLLEKGATVHVLVRDLTSAPSLALQSLGATLFKGDFDDIPAITAAMQGVDGVFLNPAPGAETRVAEIFVAAARAAGTVTSFVLSTAFKAELYDDWSEIKTEWPFLASYYTNKTGAEKAIRASGFTYTILRPGWLMHNYIGAATAYQFPEYPTDRVLAVSYPREYRVGHLDGADVGKFAAAALLDPLRFAGKELELINESI